jgi:pimeloyl-ACP methyl ester carboxylesterase
VLRERRVTGEEVHKVRRTITLRDGRMLEYFTLGPPDGYPVVHFDALAGMTIDIVGYPAECLRHLERHNVRLITPCRPGGFRSDMKQMTSLRDFAPDVEELLDRLGVGRFSICSVSYGCGTAMAVAHELQHRIDRVIMSSVSYPEYKHPDWRELDLFYQMYGILGRYWPSMLRQIIPFLVRSVMQNVDRYFDRTCKKAKSDHDIALLSHPTMRRRTVEMLAERTASGMDGMVEENLLNAQGWDFNVRDIRLPVEIAHGTLDNVSPIQGAELLAAHLPDARLFRLEGKGHYHHIATWPSLLARASGNSVEIGEDQYTLVRD